MWHGIDTNDDLLSYKCVFSHKIHKSIDVFDGKFDTGKVFYDFGSVNFEKTFRNTSDLVC